MRGVSAGVAWSPGQGVTACNTPASDGDVAASGMSLSVQASHIFEAAHAGFSTAG